jgi:tetratricopeptide (TPR) repeat protein
MDILKHSLLVTSFLCISIFGTAQTNDLQKGFENSYTFENQSDYTKAIQSLKQVYIADSYPINLRLGWLYYSAGQFAESVTYYQKAINLMPMSIEARLGMHYPLGAQGKWDQVIDSYKQVLKIDAKNYTANYNLASIYYSRKEYLVSESFLTTIVNLYPFDYSASLLFAWTNLQLGKNREATLLFNSVLLYAPYDTSAKEGLSLLK